MRRSPQRFRRRLTFAFIGVGAAAAGMLAVTSYLLIHDHRISAFHQRAEDRSELAALTIREPVTEDEFEAVVDEYRVRGDAEIVAVAGGTVHRSSAEFGPEDAPGVQGLRPGEVRSTETRVGGSTYYVVGRALPRGLVLYLFFSEEEIQAGLTDFRNVLALGWVLVTLGSAFIGDLVARRTLRPVREAAQASRHLAEGLLDTRLEPSAADEFGAWAQSFNEMADALAAKIAALSEAEQRERRFTSDVAHELRTPLAGMSMAAGMLAEHVADLPPDGRRCAEILIHDTVGLQELVLELLELARIDAQSDPVEAEPFNLRAAVTTVAGDVAGAEAVQLRIPEDLFVNADRARFRRVMTNLLTNAVVHGGGLIEVAAVRRNQEVVISVRDHGPGIPAGSLERIFDRFFKADTSRSKGGTGLGLAIAAEHARAQRGALTAANAPDGGAVFTLTLPAAPALPEGTEIVSPVVDRPTRLEIG